MFVRAIRSLLIFICCIFLAFLITTIQSPRSLAAANPITITSQSDTVSFPKSIDFQVSATDSSANITMGTVYVKDSYTTYSTPHIVNVTNLAHTVTLHSYDDISGNNFASPGTQITYYWVLQDSQGNSYSGPFQTFTVIDTRFSWQHLNQGMLQVNWYNRSTDFGQTILTKATENLNRIEGNLGGKPLHPINVWIYQNTNDFHGSLPPGTFEWVGGVAFPKINQASIVVETSSDFTLIRDMPHELTHLLFHQLAGANSIYVPAWFDEGLAVYNQSYHEADMKLTFQQALKKQSLLRLNTLIISFPADANQAYLAYAQSWNLVDYMYKTFGAPKMAALIKALNTPSNDFNSDLMQTMGINEDQLENQWHLSLQQPATMAPDQGNYQPILSPSSVHVASDPYAPLLLLLGILLIFTPLVGLGGLFTYQRRSSQPVHVATQPSMIINPAPYVTAPVPPVREPYISTMPPEADPYLYYSVYPPQSLPDTPKTQESPVQNRPPSSEYRQPPQR